MRHPLCILAFVAMAFELLAPRAFAQGEVLIREVVSREFSIHVGGTEVAPLRELASREISLFIENGLDSRQVISREMDVVRVSDVAPPAISELAVTVSAIGDTATLDWSAYNQWAVGDIQRFDVYMSETGPFSDVTGLTPIRSVGGGESSVTLLGLVPFRDRFFAVVAVDALGRFIPLVTYSAAYVLSPEAISREVSISIGNDSDRQVVSRELDIAVVNAAAPPAITNISVTTSASGDSATLDWSGYNQWAIGDIQRFDIYLSDAGPFTSVAGLTPYATVGGGATSLSLAGLTAGRDHFFAIVPVDALGNFLPAVNYSAAYVLSPEVISRELSVFIGQAPPDLVRTLGDIVAVGNHSFESLTTTNFIRWNSMTTAQRATFGWTGAGNVGNGGPALFRNGGSWGYANVPEGTQAVSLQLDSSIAMSITFPAAGDYWLSWKAASRAGQVNPFVVKLDGNPVATAFSTSDTAWKEMSVALSVGASGAHTVTFAGQNTTSDTSVGIDEVTLFRLLPFAPRPVADVRELVSREMDILVPDAAIPAPVTGINSGFNITTSTTAFGSVELDWTSYNETAQRDVFRYRVYVGTSFFSTVDGLTPSRFVPAGNQRYTLSGLTGGGIFHIAVVAEDLLGGFDPVVRSFSAQASISGVGEVVNLAGVSGINSILYSWAPPPGVGGFLRGYRVYFGGSAVPVDLPAAATSWEATGLTPATGYTFRIVTLDPFNNESSGATLIGSTLLGNPTPLELTIRNGQVVLLWPAAQPTALVSHYEVYRANAAFTNISAATRITAGPATEAPLGSFAAVSGQHYAVVTVNNLGGNSPAVTSIEATKQVQTITFPQPTAGVVTPLSASAGSALPVRYTLVPAGLAAVNGASLIALSGGRVTVTALQDGNADFWPADPVSHLLRLPPVITAFTASGAEILPGLKLRNIDETLRVTAVDADGIARAEFFIRPASGGPFTSLGEDVIPGNGLSVNLPLDAFPAGNYELRAVVATPENVMNEIIRTVELQLGPPPAPTITSPLAGAIVNTQTVTISGTTVRGSEVFILRNGTQLAGPILPDASGAFSTSVVLLPGENVFAARAANTAGDGLQSAPRTVTLRSALTVELNAPSLTEGGSATLRVLRNHTQNAITVALSASLPGQLTLPATLTIAAGETEVSVAVGAINDTVAEADKEVTISATSAGYVSGNVALTLVDNDRAIAPDLTVLAITAPAVGLPGQTVQIAWTVKNQGNSPATAWVDQVFLSDDGNIGGDRLLGTSPAAATLAAGETVSRTLSVTVPALSAGARFVVVRVNTGGDIFENETTNNAAIDDAALDVQAALALNLGRLTVVESNGTFSATLTRNGTTTAPLSVTLDATPTGVLQFPTSVEIAAGETTATFTIAPVNDSVVSPTRNVVMTAQAAGYAASTAPLSVTDDEAPALAVEIAPNSVPEDAANPAAMGTVRRNSATTAALTVTLVSSAPTTAGVPQEVIIPAGAESATFPITVQDDEILTGNRTVRISASAAGHAGNSASITLIDEDPPTITLSLSPAAVPENAQAPAGYGTILRQRPATRDIVVRLENSAPALVTMPSQVVIPADALSAIFPFTVLNDTQTNGERSVLITATETDSVIQQPILGQVATATLRVFDDEGPTLELAASADTVVSGQSLNITLARKPGAVGALTVTLASSDALATIPSTVAMADGEATVTFTATAAAGVTASTPITLTATAPGLNAAACAFTITSGAQPDLAVDSISPAAASGAGGTSIAVSWTIANDGTAVVFGNWVDRIFISKERQSATGQAVATQSASGPIAIGEGYTRTAQITLPSAPGLYWLSVQTDSQGEVAEGSEQNNALIAATQIEVLPAYRATVATDVTVASSGTPIALRGRALSAMDQTPVPQVLVSVRVLVSGTRRVFTALTDATGDYLITFRPLATEAGNYSVAADHPGVSEDAVQDSFELVGMTSQPPGITARLAPNQALSGELMLRNISARSLAGISATLQTTAANLTAQIQAPASLAVGEEAVVSYTLTASDASITRIRGKLHFISTEGAVLDVPVDVTVAPLVANLVANPGVLTRGMLRGAQTLMECEIANLGGAASGDLEVLLPTNFPWLTLASLAEIPSLAPGERTKLTLQLLPGATLPLNLYSGSILVRAAQTSVSIPFQFRAISEAVGDVRVDVLDDYTYHVAGAPRVADATVRLRDPFDQSIVVAQGTTAADGSITFSGIREGSYWLEVSADKHSSYRNGLTVNAGTLTRQNVFLDRQTVTYTWVVVPTEIADRYEIQLVATFEVDVPVPVVTMELSQSTIPDLAPGESFQVDMKLTNHGLLAAEQIEVQVPGLDTGYEFVPLVRQFDEIAAKSSVTVPIIVRRPVAGFAQRSVARAAGGPTNCTPFTIVLYSYECGPDRRYHRVGQPFVIQGQACPGAGGGTFNPRPQPGGPGGGTIHVGPGTVTQSECDPCAAIKAKATLDCILGFIPGYDLPKCGYALYNCASDGLDGKVTVPYTCMRAGYDCASAVAGGTPLGPAWAVLDCVVGFGQAYLDCKKVLAGGGGNTRQMSLARFRVSRTEATAVAATGAVPELAEMLEWSARLNDQLDAFAYIFGDRIWLTSTEGVRLKTWLDAFFAATLETSDGTVRVTDSEKAALLAVPLPSDITLAMATKLIERNNRTADYYDRGILKLTDVPAGASIDFYALDVAQEKFGRSIQAQTLSEAQGFESPLAGLVKSVETLRDQGAKQTQGVCARVKIQIDQEAVLTRQAFMGTMEVTNNSETNAMQDVRVVLDIRDSDGNSVNGRFFIKGPEVTGMAGAAGNGVLAPGATGRLQYTFIPTREAAPLEPTVYSFAGTLQFSDGAQQVALPLLPANIVVRPDARLSLKYFLQRDVHSDDPFTDGVEPAEPFSLGLIVTNTGRGTAKNFSITSGQPKIIENEKGLLIDFKIIGTRVGNQELEPTLKVDLGNIEPAGSQVAQFIMECSLQGKFIDYKASFEHASELGGMATSLIDGVEIFELIHPVRADRDDDDDLPDFLTNQVTDPENAPDTLHLSDGSVAVVNLATSPASTGGGFIRQLTLNQPSGWSYVRLPDPGAGLKLIRVVRSDDVDIRVGDNVWQTDRTFPTELSGARRELSLHLFDFDGTGTYTLFYDIAQTPGLLPPAVQIAQLGPVEPGVRNVPLDSVDVVFTRPVDAATFTRDDVTLRRNAGANLVNSGVSVTSLGETAFRIAGLAALTTDDGTYAISVQSGTIADLSGRAGQGSASALWAMSATRLVVVSAGGFGVDAVRKSVTSVDVVFSRAANGGSFTTDDLILTLDGGANLITSAVTITSVAPNVFRVASLGGLTTLPGDYTFAVLADGVNDTDGLAGTGRIEESFSIDSAGPTAEIAAVSPNPRSDAISALTVTFSEPVATNSFGTDDVSLRRNGRVVSLAEASIREVSAGSFAIEGLAAATAAAGDYALSVNTVGVTDRVGNTGSGTATRSWKVQLKRPAAPTKVAVLPDTGASAKDGIVKSRAASIVGRVAVGNSFVRATDLTTGGALGEVAVTTAAFSIPVDLGGAGTHDVAVVVVDAAGNVSEPTMLRVFVDITPPSAFIGEVTPSPREDAVSSLSVSFSENLNVTTFAIADCSLTRDGVAVPLAKAVKLVRANAAQFSIAGLDLLTDDAGVYVFTVNATGVEDIAGNAGNTSATTTWRRLDGEKTRNFASYAGEYLGLLRDAVPTHETSGILSVKLAKTGAFTGTLTRGGKRSTLRGKLDAEGRFAGIVGTYGITLSLEGEFGADAFTGTLNGPGGDTTFITERVIHSKTFPTTLAGAHTLLLAPEGQGGLPSGTGIATLSMTAAGKLKAVGEFADGSKFSQSSSLIGEDAWAFYTMLAKGQGSALAQIYFRDRSALSDLDGSVHWFRPAAATHKVFPHAFETILPLIGSRYTPAPQTFTTLRFSNGGLSEPLALPLTWSPTGVGLFSTPGTLRPKLSLNAKTGIFSGTFLAPSDKAAAKFKGAVFLKQNVGRGYFLRPTNGGTVELLPSN